MEGCRRKRPKSFVPTRARRVQGRIGVIMGAVLMSFKSDHPAPRQITDHKTLRKEHECAAEKLGELAVSLAMLMCTWWTCVPRAVNVFSRHSILHPLWRDDMKKRCHEIELGQMYCNFCRHQAPLAVARAHNPPESYTCHTIIVHVVSMFIATTTEAKV